MSTAIFESATWPDNVIPLLDDHHLVVLSDDPAARQTFGTALGSQLALMEHTSVVEIDGAAAFDLPSLESQLRLSIAGPRAETPISDSVDAIIELLRGSGAFRRRFIIWHDADAMLDADVGLFSCVVNAMMGVAAECEYISFDRLLVQRVIFIGGAKLGAYAEDVNGQFHKWLDGEEDSPLWEVMSVVERPPVLTYRIDG